MSHLFGPVNSRRLGLSLGVDLIPRKTCPYDCIYCEVGPTTQQTAARLEYDVDAIIRELEEYLAREGAPDFLTLAGSGEPTLNLGLGRIIRAIKDRCLTRVAVLTNGALLCLPEVRAELMAADVILPTLVSAREETWRAVHRPLPELSLERVIAGLEALAREYQGQVWLEVMVLKGLNDTEEELTALKKIIRRLAPAEVQLNTAVRPGADAGALPLNREEMAAVAAFLGEGAQVIASASRAVGQETAVSDARFLEMLSRRPMTAADLAQALGLTLAEVEEKLKRLCESGAISHSRYQEQVFYRKKLDPKLTLINYDLFGI